MPNITLQTYQDPEVVEAYIQKNSLAPKQRQIIEELVAEIGSKSSKKVLDLGCGPGHDSYIFAELGFETVGLDFSSEMIKQAKKLHSQATMPRFMVGDMTKLPEYFEKSSFEVIWASASLLHIPKEDIDSVLAGISHVAKPNASIFISLKSGEGTAVVTEDVYGPQRAREFTFWQKDEFRQKLLQHGFIVEKINTFQGRVFQGKPTEWYQYFCKSSA